MSVVQFKPQTEPEVIGNAAPAEGVRLNLGCNKNALKGYINVDVVPYPNVDVVADLEQRWPWDDDTVDEIIFADLPEHIRQVWERPNDDSVRRARNALASGKLDVAVENLLAAITRPQRTYGIIHFMNEAWRVLKPGGLMKGMIPSTSGNGWAQDPTHVSYWNENTFLYFSNVPGNMRGLYEGIKANFSVDYIATTKPNVLGVSWIKAVLRKPAAQTPRGPDASESKPAV